MGCRVRPRPGQARWTGAADQGDRLTARARWARRARWATRTNSAGEVAGQRYDQRFDDPATTCNPANILFGWTHDQHVNEIAERRRSHSAKPATWTSCAHSLERRASEDAHGLDGGPSTGTWDGDVLVVDTIGFAPSVLIPIVGLMHSDQMHVVRRFSVDRMRSVDA
jgi:hypothetical protein